jgi:predicted transcriptional regulator
MIWQHLIANLDEGECIQRICRKLDTEYQLNAFRELERMEVVELRRKGRANLVYLTDKGKELRRAMKKVHKFSMEAQNA